MNLVFMVISAFVLSVAAMYGYRSGDTEPSPYRGGAFEEHSESGPAQPKETSPQVSASTSAADFEQMFHRRPGDASDVVEIPITNPHNEIPFK